MNLLFNLFTYLLIHNMNTVLFFVTCYATFFMLLVMNMVSEYTEEDEDKSFVESMNEQINDSFVVKNMTLAIFLSIASEFILNLI